MQTLSRHLLVKAKDHQPTDLLQTIKIHFKEDEKMFFKCILNYIK